MILICGERHHEKPNPIKIVIAEFEFLAKIDDTETGSATPGKKLLNHIDWLDRH
jgi:hypothetical protein